jgi:hypothetical protein
MCATFRIDSVSDLLAAANQPDVWVLEGLIEAGDQVVLAGAPKAGKSLKASQIALAVASGGQYLGWKAPRPRKVLYVNLELRPKRFGRRVINQVGGARYLTQYTNLHVINDLRTLDILDTDQRNEFAEMVKTEGFELVIWDVLARMHGADENDNPAMRAVMHAIRVASADRAHIILHHMRKPAGGQEDVNLGAAGMRGASSIHGEADLIMSLHVRSGQGARYSLKFSARNIEAPDEVLLDRDSNLLFHEAAEAETHRLRSAILSAFDGAPACLATTLHEHVMTAFDVKERRAKQLIEVMVKSGEIVRRQRNDKRYEYWMQSAPDLITLGKHA